MPALRGLPKIHAIIDSSRCDTIVESHGYPCERTRVLASRLLGSAKSAPSAFTTTWCLLSLTSGRLYDPSQQLSWHAEASQPRPRVFRRRPCETGRREAMTELAAQPKRRPTACAPCNERKVRCDASVVGTPCTRCVSKGRVHECHLIPPRQSNRAAAGRSRRRLQSIDPESRVRATNTTLTNPARTRNAPLETFVRDAYGHDRADGPLYAAQSLQSPVGRLMNEASNEVPYALSEEDGHVQTLHRMTSAVDSASPHANEPRNQEVVEYYGKLNSLSILGQVLGHPQQRRLIQLDIPGPRYASARQREVAHLSPVDRNYLESRQVFTKPPEAAW